MAPPYCSAPFEAAADDSCSRFDWMKKSGDKNPARQQARQELSDLLPALPAQQLRRSRSNVSYADLVREERKARRSNAAARSFPPPLGSLARKSYAQCPNQVPWVRLQPIRSNGRIILQQVDKISNQMSMQPIRTQGRLVLNLVRHGADENRTPRPMAPKAGEHNKLDQAPLPAAQFVKKPTTTGATQAPPPMPLGRRQVLNLKNSTSPSPGPSPSPSAYYMHQFCRWSNEEEQQHYQRHRHMLWEQQNHFRCVTTSS